MLWLDLICFRKSEILEIFQQPDNQKKCRAKTCRKCFYLLKVIPDHA